MNRVVLPAEVREQLNGGAELTDEHGQIVGQFFSQESFDRIASTLLPDPAAEELAEARREMLEKGGVSTEELLSRIERMNRLWDSKQ
jgi:transcriptional regulator GlxA family with amidase domain